MEPIAIFEILRRHIAMVIVVTAVATVVGYGVSYLLPTRYTATALVLVRPQQPIKLSSQKAKEFLDFPLGFSTTVETAAKTYIEIAKSPALLGDVVRQLGLDKKMEAETRGWSRYLPEFLRTRYDDFKKFLHRSLLVLRYGKVIHEDPFTTAVKTVDKYISMKSILDTYAFSIEYKSKDPQEAADVANADAKTLVKFINDLRLKESRNQARHLRAEVEEARQRVNAAASQLENYKKTHSTLLYKSEYDSRLRVIADLEVELAKVEAAQVASQNTPSTINLEAKRNRLMRSIAERKAALAPMPAIERELKRYNQEVDDATNAYTAVEQQYEQLNLNEAYPMPEVSLVSPAVAPLFPSRPARLTIALVSLIAGLVVGVGLAFVLEYLNRGVRSIHDVEDFVGVKVLATIPRISGRHWRLAGLL